MLGVDANLSDAREGVGVYLWPLLADLAAKLLALGLRNGSSLIRDILHKVGERRGRLDLCDLPFLRSGLRARTLLLFNPTPAHGLPLLLLQGAPQHHPRCLGLLHQFKEIGIGQEACGDSSLGGLVLPDLLGAGFGVVQRDLGQLLGRAERVDGQFFPKLVERVAGGALQQHARGVEGIARRRGQQRRFNVHHHVGRDLRIFDELRQTLQADVDRSVVVKALVRLDGALDAVTPVGALGDDGASAAERGGHLLSVERHGDPRIAAREQVVDRVATVPAGGLDVVDGQDHALLVEGCLVASNRRVQALRDIDRIERVHLPAEVLAAPQQNGFRQPEAARLALLLRGLGRFTQAQERVEHHAAGHARAVVFPFNRARGFIPAHVEPPLALADQPLPDRLADRIAAVLKRLARGDEVEVLRSSVDILRSQLPELCDVALDVSLLQGGTAAALQQERSAPLARELLAVFHREQRGRSGAPHRSARTRDQANHAQGSPNAVLHARLACTRFRHHNRSRPVGLWSSVIQASATALAWRSSGCRSCASSSEG